MPTAVRNVPQYDHAFASSQEADVEHCTNLQAMASWCKLAGAFSDVSAANSLSLLASQL